MAKSSAELRELLKKALDDQGLDASTLSRKIGRGKDYIGDFIRGKKESLKAEEFEKIRRAIGSEEGQSKEAGDTMYDMPPVGDGLPLRGFAQAGVWREVDGEPDQSPTTHFKYDQRFKPEAQFALVARGQSMDAATPQPIADGMLLKCVEFGEYGSAIRHGQIVIVDRYRGDRTLLERSVRKVNITRGITTLICQSVGKQYEPIIMEGLENDNRERFEDLEIYAVVLGVYRPLE